MERVGFSWEGFQWKKERRSGIDAGVVPRPQKRDFLRSRTKRCQDLFQPESGPQQGSFSVAPEDIFWRQTFYAGVCINWRAGRLDCVLKTVS